MAYWWDGDSTERYWVEIRKVSGIGTELYCPDTRTNGGADPWYELVASVAKGEVVYHWNAHEHRFVGRSVASSDAVAIPSEGLYTVPLENFTPIHAEVGLSKVRAIANDLYAVRDELEAQHGRPLYLPFQFTQNRNALAFMSNYFAKLPLEMVQLLFGQDGLAGADLPALPPSPGNALGPAAPTGKWPMRSRRSFLQPFRAKADTKYVVDIEGGRRTHTRNHETLVNGCADWLASKGLEPGRNAAIDLGLSEPAVIMEAKVIGASWATSVREAVGQLYEYRYFKIADPKAALIFLADKPVPADWVEYLEKDRRIGAMWPHGRQDFAMSRLTKRALRL
jgi:hypothetical protein